MTENAELWKCILYLRISFITIHCLLARGEYSKKFYTGRLRSEVQTLTLLYTIFFRKGTPFVYLLLEKGTPFIYLQEDFLSFFHVARNKLK